MEDFDSLFTNIDKLYEIIFFAFILFIFIAIYNLILKIRYSDYIKKSIDTNWGTKKEKKEQNNNIILLSKYISKNSEINDKTWNDFNMDLLLSEIDHTESYLGTVMLKYLLKNPKYNIDDIETTFSEISEIKSNIPTAKRIKQSLAKIGENLKTDVSLFLENGIDPSEFNPKIYIVLGALPLFSILLFFINKKFALILLIVSLLTNIVLSEKIKKEIYSHLKNFKEIGKIIQVANRIKILSPDILYDRINKITATTDNLNELNSKLARYTSFNDMTSEMSALSTLVSMFFLIEPINFFLVRDLINNHINDIRILVEEVGKLDAVLGMASYLDYNKNYCKVKWDSDVIHYENTYHPLLKSPVPNSITVCNPKIILSGSNASGKSTFLKLIGINQIFAQTFGICFAESAICCIHKITSSMNSEDDISSGDSYFMSEAKAVKKIVDSVKNNDIKHLIIMDELFRGTNTVERINSTFALLNYLSNKHDTSMFIATHDLELISSLNHFENYHFSELIENDNMKFDYKLKNGPAKSTNALEIIRIVGFPKEIYLEALNEPVVKSRDY
ncbi:MutS-related protein [Peptostreptococcus sp. D1]|uniref:MutS-related protein n=1 Tax=Peptostreptococcus sp. D1 TaxID=72304 RepID=UPI0008E3ECEA|nr:hypothetical protein [Peptostreptococcus sp. D1]SFE20728.1 MutS domain V [Peptostreptococcus sp. D1]